MQNRTFLVLLRPIFGEKMKTAPPKKIGCRSCEVDAVIRPEKAFEFPILAEKSVSISMNTFFFLEITWFRTEKAFEFLILAKKSVSILMNTFFFLEITWFRAEKAFEFPILAEKSVSIFG